MPATDVGSSSPLGGHWNTMSLETAQFIHQLNPANPAGSDRLQQGDDHLRMVKSALKATFPGFTGPLTLTNDFLNGIAALVVPIGLIAAWYGDDASVPTGWAICDGRTSAKSDGSGNITLPDLRGRALVGASEAHQPLSTWGQESRTATTSADGGHVHTASTNTTGDHNHSVSVQGHALTIDEMPAHHHTIFTGNGGSTAWSADPDSGSGLGDTSDAGGSQAHSHGVNQSEAGGHSHQITVDPAYGHSHSVTVDVTQPSLALHYIMKV